MYADWGLFISHICIGFEYQASLVLPFFGGCNVDFAGLNSNDSIVGANRIVLDGCCVSHDGMIILFVDIIVLLLLLEVFDGIKSMVLVEGLILDEGWLLYVVVRDVVVGNNNEIGLVLEGSVDGSEWLLEGHVVVVVEKLGDVWVVEALD